MLHKRKYYTDYENSMIFDSFQEQQMATVAAGAQRLVEVIDLNLRLQRIYRSKHR